VGVLEDSELVEFDDTVCLFWGDLNPSSKAIELHVDAASELTELLANESKEVSRIFLGAEAEVWGGGTGGLG